MKRLIFIVGFVAWFLVGCYDDKGNYDYKDINTIDGLTFMPTPITVPAGTGRIEGDLFSGVYPKYGGRRG